MELVEDEFKVVEEVKEIIVAYDFSNDLILEIEKQSTISLKRYQIKLDFFDLE